MFAQWLAGHSAARMTRVEQRGNPRPPAAQQECAAMSCQLFKQLPQALGSANDACCG
jgi:hypothetical protein